MPITHTRAQEYNLRRQLPYAVRKRIARTMLELRARELSYPAIAVVIELYEGIEMTAEQVRYWLRVDYDVAINEKKSLATTIQNMRQRGG